MFEGTTEEQSAPSDSIRSESCQSYQALLCACLKAVLKRQSHFKVGTALWFNRHESLGLVGLCGERLPTRAQMVSPQGLLCCPQEQHKAGNPTDRRGAFRNYQIKQRDILSMCVSTPVLTRPPLGVSGLMEACAKFKHVLVMLYCA